jgi:hypothetical protein
MNNRLENPTKHALELQGNIIESAKTLQKHRSLLRLSLADAEKNKTYLHIPGKKFTSFVEYLEYLAPKTKISVKRMRKLAKAGTAEELLIEADINTVNMSDIALITLGQNVPKEQVANVYRKAVNDNDLVKTAPSESQIIEAAKKLGVFKQKRSKVAANNQSSSKGNTKIEKASSTLGNKGNEKKLSIPHVPADAEEETNDNWSSGDHTDTSINRKPSESSNVIPFSNHNNDPDPNEIATSLFENLKRDDTLTAYELISDFLYKLEESGEYNPEIISVILNILKKGSLEHIQQITSRIGIKLHMSSPSQKRKRRKARSSDRMSA